MSSSLGILKRVRFRSRSGCEGLSAGGPRLREHAVLQCKDTPGANLTAGAAIYPPALRAAVLRGIAAQRAREG
eukprot:1732551-Alexandrium_andersonii.AAC.1